ncbi:MAG: hypothetical protein GKR99_00160 [Rhodobacteraceae bacterium]|nr:hypothetical protein [Paracoccaceae bacterium]
MRGFSQLLLCVFILTLVGCGRQLSEAETDYLGGLLGSGLAVERVRVSSTGPEIAQSDAPPRLIVTGSALSCDAPPDTRAILMAHEATHVWQWQNRDITGYSPFAAVMENIRARDPYSYELEAGKPFLDYGFEQQARIVGDFVCHSAADPNSAKTKALGALLKPVFGPGATLAGRN